MIYHRVCSKSNTTDSTNGADTAYPYITAVMFSGVRVVWSLVFCVVLCRTGLCVGLPHLQLIFNEAHDWISSGIKDYI